MVVTQRLQFVHPWVHEGVVIFARDSIGVARDGVVATVDHDVVITHLKAEPSGVAITYEPFLGQRAAVRRPREE